MDRGARQATVYGLQRIRHDWTTTTTTKAAFKKSKALIMPIRSDPKFLSSISPASLPLILLRKAFLLLFMSFKCIPSLGLCLWRLHCPQRSSCRCPHDSLLRISVQNLPTIMADSGPSTTTQHTRTWNNTHPIIHWKGWCWGWSSSTLATWCREPTH